MKTKAEIKQTTNYGLFTYHENQQPMKPSLVRKVVDSMRSTGFWPSKPIGVYRSAGKLVIIDGHHRFEAAKTLGLPILFVEEPKSHEHLIGEANYIGTRWTNESFAKLYASRGNPDYQDLLFYVERGIPLKQASSLLSGESAHSGNSGQFVRRGTFKIKTDKYINEILCIIDAVKEIAPEIAKRAYIDALSLLMFLPEFDSDILIKRIQAHPTGIVRCADRSQALESLEEVYNFRAREKTPLAFMAKDAARKRQLTGLNGSK